MNCKPGDLAVIVRTFPETRAVLGKPIRVVSHHVLDGEVVWIYEGMPLRGMTWDGPWTWHELPDAWLLPLRDPGDDAVDETLLWKPLPKEDALREELRARVKEMP